MEEENKKEGKNLISEFQAGHAFLFISVVFIFFNFDLNIHWNVSFESFIQITNSSQTIQSQSLIQLCLLHFP